MQFPDQGLNLSLLPWEHGILATGPLGKSQLFTKGFIVILVALSLDFFSQQCVGSEHYSKPFLDFINYCCLKRLRIFKIISFPSIYLFPFTSYYKQAVFSTLYLESFLARSSSSLGIFSAFHITEEDSVAKISATAQQGWPFLHCSSFPFQSSPPAFSKFRFLLTVSAKQFRFSLMCFSKSFQLPPTAWFQSYSHSKN